MGDRVKKNWLKPPKQGIPKGALGVLVTVEGNEKAAVREFYNLIDTFVDAEKQAGRIYYEKEKEEDSQSSTCDAADELAAELADLKDKKLKTDSSGYSKPKQFPTNVKNILFFQMPCTPDELYELGRKFIERCQEMRCCRYIARCTPFENVIDADEEALGNALGRVIEKHFGLAKDKKDTYSLEFKARCNDKLKFDQVLKIVDFHMANFAPLSKVNLGQPDKTIVVHVVHKAVLVGCISNYMDLRRYSAKPKAGDDSSVDDEEERRRKEEEDEKFAGVTKFLAEQKKAVEERKRLKAEAEKLNESNQRIRLPKLHKRYMKMYSEMADDVEHIPRLRDLNLNPGDLSYGIVPERRYQSQSSNGSYQDSIRGYRHSRSQSSSEGRQNANSYGSCQYLSDRNWNPRHQAAGRRFNGRYQHSTSFNGGCRQNSRNQHPKSQDPNSLNQENPNLQNQDSDLQNMNPPFHNSNPQDLPAQSQNFQNLDPNYEMQGSPYLQNPNPQLNMTYPRYGAPYDVLDDLNIIDYENRYWRGFFVNTGKTRHKFAKPSYE
ncbi:unnamed protein product [Bursaphelenchus okinawaensis]|uniref:THUMP domain-containing protein n=1 Tax=Bursaphelenchus okinawaensis TaxID=465554 RepID=A0A811L6V2_9BILA|nr:unnamed protein product [Bursaphelenchus okinawaensis]CAG9117745.1 unnamed protein product [Bursaphelenchus okinawaensis]